MGGDILGIFEFKQSVVFEFGPEEFNIGIAKGVWKGGGFGNREERGIRSALIMIYAALH